MGISFVQVRLPVVGFVLRCRTHSVRYKSKAPPCPRKRAGTRTGQPVGRAEIVATKRLWILRRYFGVVDD